MKEKLGFLSAATCTVLATIAALSPGRVADLRVDFGLFALRQLRYELVTVIIVGGLFFSWKYVKPHLVKIKLPRPSLSNFSQRQQIASVPIVSGSIVLVIFLVSSIWTLGGGIASSRIDFYRDFMYRLYRQDRVRYAFRLEKEGRLEAAMAQYKLVLDSFPEGSGGYLEKRIETISSRIVYAKEFFDRSEKLERGSHFSRRSLKLLLEALRTDPTNDFLRTDAAEKMRQLDVAQKSSGNFYDAVAAGNEKQLAELYEEWSWYLFEEYFDQQIRGAKGRHIPMATELAFVRSISRQEFVERVERSWELEAAEEIFDASNKTTKRPTNPG